MYRDHTKVVQIGNKKIGGGNPILIQSMTNTKRQLSARFWSWKQLDVILSVVQCRLWKLRRH